MKIWNVNISYSQRENEDLGTYGTKEKAMEVATTTMATGLGWTRTYLTDDNIHYSNGSWKLVVESIYVA